MWSFDEPRGERRPHVAGVAEAVKQHDRGAVAADADVNGRAVGRNVLDVEAGRERRDCGRGRGRGSQHCGKESGNRARANFQILLLNEFVTQVGARQHGRHGAR